VHSAYITLINDNVVMWTTDRRGKHDR